MGPEKSKTLTDAWYISVAAAIKGAMKKATTGTGGPGVSGGLE